MICSKCGEEKPHVREVANPFDADVNNDPTNIQPLCDACYGELCDDAGQMDRPDLRPPSLVLGHLTITIPIVVIILVTFRVGYYTLGSNLWPYYVTGGLGLGWQWYSLALPRWKASMMRVDAQDREADEVARRNGLLWPGTSAIGLFALHTTAAAICGIHLGPWLVGRWFGWILPALGEPPSGLAADYYLQHLELVSIFPALVVGYISSRYLPRVAAWAWILPTTIMGYKLWMFHDLHRSVLATDHWARFSYYFVIERFMPTFYNFRGSDPSRVAAQLTAVAPFYSGIAYSIGALTPKMLKRIRENLSREPEPEIFGPEEAGVVVVADHAVEQDK